MVRLNSKGQVQHPAKFTRTIMDEIQQIMRVEYERVQDPMYVFDPMGGVGGVFDVHLPEQVDEFYITCIEIEPEWAREARMRATLDTATDKVHIGNFFAWADLYPDMEWDVCITSPTYGNRMADNHTPGVADTSVRNTYRHILDRPLTDGSSAGMQWGDEYRAFHDRLYREVFRLLKPTGLFVLNVKDHVRKGRKQPVAMWTKRACQNAGFELEAIQQVPVKGNGMGQNGQTRVDFEVIYTFRRPAMQLDKKALKWTQPRLTGPEGGQ